MKIRIFALISTFLLLFCACGKQGGGADGGMKIADKIAEKFQICTFTAEITADFGDRTDNYRVKADRGEDGGITLKILEPQELAGIKARVGKDSLTLIYDDIILESGTLPRTALSPADALPAFIRAMTGGNAAEQASTKWKNIRTYQLIYKEGKITIQLWFDAETLNPVRGEIFSEGQMVVSANFA